MKTILKIVMVIVCFTVSSKFAFADTYEDSRGLTWNYSYNSKLEGAVVNSVSGYFWLPSMEYPITDPIGEVQIPFQFPNNNPYALHYNLPTVEIGRGVFSRCDRLTEVVVPSSIVVIGDSAFLNCTNLRSVASTYNAHGVVIHNGVTDIENYAFCGCSKLASVVIPDSVINLGAGAFEYCAGLKSVIIGNGVTGIWEDVFAGCCNITAVTIPQLVCSTRLSYVFPSSYQNITNVVMSASVGNIGDRAFSGCISLTSVSMPDSVTNIEDYAFYNCSSLNSVTIPNGVTKIGMNAFFGCSRLANVTIPSSVKNIGNGAFSGTQFYNNLPDGMIVFGKIAYKMKGSCPEEVIISNDVEIIGDSAFSQCKPLSHVTIPNSVTSICDSAFAGCNNLSSIKFEGDAPTIGQWCFLGVKSSCTVYVDKDSTGWNVAIPGSWNGMRIEYAPTMIEVSFDTTGGSLETADSFRTIISGTGVGLLPVPTRYGYVFMGWWTTPSGGTQVLADTVVTEDVTYYAQWEKIQTPTYIIENGVLTGVLDWNDCDSVLVPDDVTSIGSFAFRGCQKLVSVTIPNSVTNIGYGAFCDCSRLASVDIGKNVTSIGEQAFACCSSITCISIPGSVKNIGCCAFYYCNNLESVNITDGVEEIADSAFSFCYNLTSVAIPNSIKSIGSNSFRNCSRLTSLRIPSSVTNIGSYAFSDCSNLKSVIIPDDVISIGKMAFAETPFYKTQPNGLVVFGSVAYAIKGTCPAVVTIPEGVVSISESAFSGCGELTSITIPSSVEEIGTCAFQNCSGLVSIVIPNGVTSIGSYAFSGCIGLENVTIPNSVIGIGRDAFNGTPFYSNLPDGLVVLGRVVYRQKGSCPATVTIPNGVVSVGDMAFYCCSTLVNVTIPNSVLSIGQSAFAYCNGLINITIPNSVTSIESGTFDRCNNLASIAIGSGVTNIAYNAFFGCSGRTSFSVASENMVYKSHLGLLLSKDGTTLLLGINGDVTIPSCVTSIGDCAFEDCSRLTSVTIPNSVVSVGYNAFYGCDNITAVNISDLSAWCGISFEGNTANPLAFGHKLYLNGSLISNLVIPDDVVDIGAYAFYGCNGISSVTIPNNVTNIGFSAFGRCEKLLAYVVSECSLSYKSDVGLLLSKDGTTLILGVNGDVRIPSYVTSIGNYAFRECLGLTSVLIPDSVTNIGICAFYECSSLKSVTIPESVTNIGDYAFGDCKSLKKVMFDGNAPLVPYDTFSSVASGCTAYVLRSSTGWQTRVPGEWKKIKIAYFNEIALNANGGNLVGDYKRYLSGGSVVGALPMPTRTGYSFVGWFTAASGGKQISESTTVSADAIYYAHWEPSKYTVVFNANGGAGAVTMTQGYGSAIVAPTVVWVGHTFVGWEPEVADTVPASNVTYMAQWRVNQYTVAFDANGGEGGVTNEQDYASKILAPTVTREHYQFVGWSPEVLESLPASNVTYMAQWRINQYTVAFDANGGEGGVSRKFDYASEIFVPDVSRKGYTFVGWTPSVAATVPSSNVTYTAQWQINQYSVAFDANGGSGGETLTQNYGTAIRAPDVTRTGYTFIGWTPAVDSTVPASNIIYMAQWAINNYIMTFDANGGVYDGGDMSIDYGSAYGELPEPTREGHTFAGWTLDGEPVMSESVMGAADVSLVAQWTVNQYTVIFDANGGDGGKTVTQDYGTALAAPTVTRAGYTFIGWTPAVDSTVPASNITYMAQWAINNYTMTFDANGGVYDGGDMSIDYGSAYGELPEPTREGHTFAGWTLDGEPVMSESVMGAADVSLVAQWTVNQYSVIFDANGGDGGKTVTQDYGTALAAPTVTRTGYTFMGWSPAVPATVPAANATYVAQWKVNQYMVTFNANGGEGGKTLTQDYGTAVTAPTVTRTGYTFTGWTPEVAATVPANKVTYMAQWKINQYTVMFDANGGDGGKTVTQDYGSALAAPTMTRTGYTFAGWSSAVPATVPATNATYIAQWTTNQYTVTFDANGGIGGKTVTQNYGTAIIAPTVTRTGYVFAGWTPAVAAALPASNVTYAAQWTLNQYTVTFDANGGDGGKTVTQDYGSALAAPTMTRTGYTFAGWSPTVPATVPTTNATYVAQWTINQYTVTFNANGGAYDGDGISLDYGSAYGELPTPIREGYTFAGWMLGGEPISSESVIGAADVALVAQWTENQYIVLFDANGGIGGVTNGQDYASEIVEPMVTRTGYTFVGWTPAVDATVPASNVTYTAQWLINTNWIEIGTASKYETEADGTIGTIGTDGTRSFDLGACVESLSQTKITVKGLPTGLKFDAKKGTISGTATKPGVYKVTVSATNATVKKPVTATFEIVVPNLASEVLPGLKAETDAYGVVRCGVSFDAGEIDCTPKSGWTVKVAGLPAGLKYDAKTGKITGVPTKAGTFTVTFTATKKGEKNQVATITLTTEALPAWSTGTFSGYVAGTGNGERGTATMTVAANGKISGKIAIGGTNWTFKADSFSRVESDPSSEVGSPKSYVVEAVAKAGKATRDLVLSVATCDGATALPNGVVEGTFGDGEVKMWRNVWKDKSTATTAKTTIAKFEGVYTVSVEDGEDYGSGYLSLTVGKNGDVKVSGKLADGTSVSATSLLAYDEDAGWFVLLYAAPPAYKGGAFAAAVGFAAQGGAAGAGRPSYRLEPVMFVPQWSSKNPQATGAYGEGFDCNVDLVGAYYDKLKKLNAYYESLRLGLDGAPELSFAFRETSLNEQGRKITVSSASTASAVDTLWQDGLTATVNGKGAIIVAKATKPVQDKETKEWSYNGANDGAITLTFTQVTGIFKGSYTFWYDYMSAYDYTTEKATLAHISKKVNFEGILVQGEEPTMDGFYLWDATGEYEDAKTGKPKTYKYKQSFPVSLRP